MREVQMKAEELEESGIWTWKDKVPKLLWRVPSWIWKSENSY